MIKKILIILCVVLLLLVLAAVIAVKTVDVNQFREQITGYVTQQIGKNVEISRLSFSFSIDDGAVLLIEDLKVGDGEKVKDYAFSAQAAALDVDLWKLITHQKLEVKSVKLKQPDVLLIISDQESEKKLKELQKGGAEPGHAAVDDSAIPSLEDLVDAKSMKNLSDVFIRNIEVIDGHLRLVKDPEDDTDLSISHIDLKIKNVKLGQFFPFQINAAVFGQQQNMMLAGDLLITKNSYQASNIRLESQLRDVEVDQIQRVLPVQELIESERGLAGQLRGEIKNLTVTDGGMPDLRAELTLTDGVVLLKPLNELLENIDIKTTIAQNSIDLSEVFLYIFGGRVSASGTIRNYLTQPDIDFKAGLEEISLSETLKSHKIPVEITGKVYGRINVTAAGADPASLMASQRGAAELRIEDAVIADFNLLKIVFERMAFIPGVAEILNQKLSRYNQERLTLKDTRFEQLNVTLAIEPDYYAIENMVAETKDFTVNYTGGISPDLTGTLRGEVLISKPLSIDMVASVPEFKYLTNKDERIVIKLAEYKGDLRNYKPNPVNVDIPIQVLRGKVEDEAKKALRKYIKVDQPASSETPTGETDSPSKADTQQQPQEAEPAPEEILIDSALDMIFGK